MERMTQRPDPNGPAVTEAVSVDAAAGHCTGKAIEQLARYEDLHAHLLQRHAALPGELEALRAAGKTKTVTFRELLGEKLLNDMMVQLFSRYGL